MRVHADPHLRADDERKPPPAKAQARPKEDRPKQPRPKAPPAEKVQYVDADEGDFEDAGAVHDHDDADASEVSADGSREDDMVEVQHFDRPVMDRAAQHGKAAASPAKGGPAWRKPTAAQGNGMRCGLSGRVLGGLGRSVGSGHGDSPERLYRALRPTRTLFVYLSACSDCTAWVFAHPAACFAACVSVVGDVFTLQGNLKLHSMHNSNAHALHKRCRDGECGVVCDGERWQQRKRRKALRTRRELSGCAAPPFATESKVACVCMVLRRSERCPRACPRRSSTVNPASI